MIENVDALRQALANPIFENLDRKKSLDISFPGSFSDMQTVVDAATHYADLLDVDETLLDPVGKVCVCSIGRLALVVGKTTMPWGETYYGVGLDGKGLWFSKRPTPIADSIEEFAERLLLIDSKRHS